MAIPGCRFLADLDDAHPARILVESRGFKAECRHGLGFPGPRSATRLCSATWHSFKCMTGPNGLSSDRLEQSHQGEWKRSNQTSPSDIACYLWATLSAQGARTD